MSHDQATGHTDGIESWVLALVSADPEELLSIGVAACAAGHAKTLVECVRCFRTGAPPMTFPAMARHVFTIETLYRQTTDDGPHTAAHGPGDIRPASPRPSTRTRRRFR